jgi:mRNA-degrading endonuclease HigB of HigAB toxin-antitoxin module
LPSVKVPSLKFSTFQTGRDNSKRYVIKIVSNRYILITYIIYDCCCLYLIHFLRLQKYDNFAI